MRGGSLRRVPGLRESTKSSRSIYEDLFVEVAGIEPASFGDDPGLLRAQLCSVFLGPVGVAGNPTTRPSSC